MGVSSCVLEVVAERGAALENSSRLIKRVLAFSTTIDKFIMLSIRYFSIEAKLKAYRVDFLRVSNSGEVKRLK